MQTSTWIGVVLAAGLVVGAAACGHDDDTSSAADGGKANSSPALEPYPPTELRCSDPPNALLGQWRPDVYDDGGAPIFRGNGFHGACCVSAHCYTPAPGEACVAPELTATVFSESPLGAGTCGCGDVQGPFAASAPADQGTCCCLVPIIACD